MSEPSRASILLQTVVGGLRDPIRHVKYPGEEKCARCGSTWPCANGAFDELREELADLERQLREKDAWIAAKCTISGCWKSLALPPPQPPRPKA